MGVRVGVHHGGGAQAGLVGEHAPGHALFEGGGDGGTGESSGRRRRGKGVREDGGKDIWDPVKIEDENDQAAGDVEERHEGYQRLAEAADPADAAEYHDSRDHGHDTGREVGIERVALEE